MGSWDCCRTCLSMEDLRPIFSEINSKFADTIYLTIGIKVEPSDCLPKVICAKCVHFINDVNIFRQNAEYTQKKLIERLEQNRLDFIKSESLEVKIEKDAIIVKAFEDDADDHHDYDDDDIPLRCLQYETKLEVKEKIKEFEIKVKDQPGKEEKKHQPEQIVFNGESKKTRRTEKKPVKRKVRTKKENTNGTKKEKSNKRKEAVKEEVECEYCHKILTSKLSLRNHYKIHTGFDFVCEHCGKKFITRRLLLMHCRAKHGYEKTDKCSYCDYRASNAEQVKIHERLHTGERPFSCAQCGAGFHRKSSYLQHVAIHLPDKTVQCEQCPARFKSVTLMRIHRQRHRAPAWRFRCEVCGGSFARRRNVARHLAAVHALPPDQKHIQRLKI